MREIRTSGSMSGDGKRDGDNASTRAHLRLYHVRGRAGLQPRRRRGYLFSSPSLPAQLAAASCGGSETKE
jgi:hypothetical protein